ncbi:MAG: L-threonylcarbamoyladenylate synthase [Pseudomonadota bacterium]|nr:L-threonylcarbamoyladenylate synthase [Pseudomonadota bacterium]
MPTPENISFCAGTLREGQLVAFPTETVYGLGADATQDRAMAAIFEAKGRPSFNPLIVHVPDMESADALVTLDERAMALAEAFWPGPLTLVLPRRSSCSVSLLASAGLDTLAVRIPAHPVARRLLQETGRPIAAPSANRSGAVSPTTPLHVAESLAGRIPYILADGRASMGLESTVLDLSGPSLGLLRPGHILREQLEALIGPVSLPESSDTQAPRAPGQLASHYAPSIPVRLNATSVQAGEALLAFGPGLVPGHPVTHLNLSDQGDLNEAAANLFAMLRALDTPDHTAIAVTPIPDTGLGIAINDRLRRAAAPRS